MIDHITIKKPFDSHVHLRRGAMLRAVTPITAEKFSRAIVMPNTEPPIETCEQAAEYKKEILGALPRGNTFEPLLTFYLTKKLTPVEERRILEIEEEYLRFRAKWRPDPSQNDPPRRPGHFLFSHITLESAAACASVI